MNDYKELVDALRCGAWSVYKVNSPAAMCETIYNAQIAEAIEELVKERDAAIADLKELSFCTYCKSAGTNCPACRGERWEWRGVQE